MKVLSLLQPWATLVVLGAKKFECRSWKTEYRGTIIIHASAKKPSKRERQYFEEDAFFKTCIEDVDFLPFGALIGTADLKDIYRTEWVVQNFEIEPHLNWDRELRFDDFSPKRYAWHLGTAHRFDTVLPMKGQLGLWEYNGLL